MQSAAIPGNTCEGAHICTRVQALEVAGGKQPDWEPDLRKRLAEADVTVTVDEGVNMVLMAAAQVCTVQCTVYVNNRQNGSGCWS